MQLLLSATVALLATSASAQTVSTLRTERASGRLAFLPYTLAQRNALLTQAETVLNSAWVNRESKAINYGPAADPTPTLQRIRANLTTISDGELQLQLSDAFIQVRDLHTLFLTNGPYRCYGATTGLFFEFVEGADADIANNPRVVVLRKDTRTALTSLLGTDFAAITAGDELVSVNGDSFAEWFRKNQFTSGAGANAFGGQRRGIDYLSYVPGIINRLPAQDTITFTFKSRATGATYSAVINYVTSRNDACYSAQSALYRRLTGRTLPTAAAPSTGRSSLAKTPAGGDAPETVAAPPAETVVTPASSARKLNPLKKPIAIVDDQFLEFKKAALGGNLALGPVRLTATSSTGLSWGIWDPQGKNLGVLRLDDFVPNDSTGQPNDVLALNTIRSLLVNQLKDTNAVLIDIRDNGGGIITYANSIPQLFKPDFNPFGARFLYNDVMKRTFVDTSAPGESFYDAYTRTAPGSKYTEIGLFDTQEAVNTLGQAYLKPVGILNNGRCYSACDMLSANFQGSATGIIFGEDGRTGAGGANVLQFENLVQLDPTDFKVLPFTSDLTVGGQNYGNGMSVGIRQSVRNGLQAGQLIEDIGITADQIVRARLSDVLPGATTSSQYDRIADALAANGAQTGKAGLFFVLEPQTFEVAAGSFRLSPQLAGLDELTVQTASGTTLATRSGIPSTGAKTTVDIDVVSVAGLGNQQLVITGKKAGAQFLKTKRSVRTVPRDADRIALARTTPFQWSLALSPAIGVYSAGASLTAPTTGWNRSGNVWRINNGVSYLDNTDTSLEFFFTATTGSRLTITLNASYATEANFDFLQLNYISSAGAVRPILPVVAPAPLPGVSGTGTLSRSFTFTTTTQRFSLAIKFISDSAVASGSGASITAFSVTTA